MLLLITFQNDLFYGAQFDDGLLAWLIRLHSNIEQSDDALDKKKPQQKTYSASN